jgi:hypothetical protein
MSWIVLHWSQVALCLGIWSLAASIVNKSLWTKPAKPKALVVLHAILIDGPAFLPSINLKGLFGLPVNVPFLTLSGGPVEPVLK